MNVGGDLALFGGTNPLGEFNSAFIGNFGTSATPANGQTNVNVTGSTLLMGGAGNYDSAYMSAYTQMILNATGSVSLVGGSGMDAAAYIEGASSLIPGTIYLNVGDPNNPATLSFLGNSYLIDAGGAGNIFLNVFDCAPAGSCTTGSPTILAGSITANFYNPSQTPPPVAPGSGLLPFVPPIFIPPNINFYNPSTPLLLSIAKAPPASSSRV